MSSSRSRHCAKAHKLVLTSLLDYPVVKMTSSPVLFGKKFC